MRLLGALVDADLAFRPERREFRVTRVGSRHGALIRHPKLGGEGTNWIRWPQQDIEDLAELGYLRLRKGKNAGVEQWQFDIRESGFRAAESADTVREPRDEVAHQHDVFISHAGEDKAEVARPLADALVKRGWNVWLDELNLTVGDSLNRRIDEALARSRFGVVVLSDAFFAKEWPKRELDGLAAKEAASGTKVILPVWHGITEEDILRYAPMLAGKFGVSTSRGIDTVAAEVGRALEAAGSISGSSRPVLVMPDDPRASERVRERTPQLSFGRPEIPRTSQAIRVYDPQGDLRPLYQGRVIRVPVSNALGAGEARHVHARLRFTNASGQSDPTFVPRPTQGEWVGDHGPEIEIAVPGNRRPRLLDVVVILDGDYPHAHEWTTQSRYAGLRGYAIKANPFRVEVDVMGAGYGGDPPRITDTLEIDLSPKHMIKADWLGPSRVPDQGHTWVAWG